MPAANNTQRFARQDDLFPFNGAHPPRLVYASRITPDSVLPHPRAMHSHRDLAEVILVVSGSGEFLLDDQRQTICAGSLLIYNAGVVHDEIADPQSALSWYCVAVTGLQLPGLGENALAPPEAGCLFPAGERFSRLWTLFDLIYQGLDGRDAQAGAACGYLTLSLLATVLAVIGERREEDLPRSDQLGLRIKRYLDVQYARPLTLQSIADDLRISPGYLSHVFKRTFGYAPMQYLTRRRIGEAQTLLLETELPVGRIAELVGYETQSYFDLQFTRHVGMPPRRYRQSMTGEGKAADRP
ncbi:MAG: helix-turn-helix transcriptional regulator [Oscillibacter sp.]|nr:helix-turn-helix transcriptional regulator [Oscillibacter sp.]